MIGGAKEPGMIYIYIFFFVCLPTKSGAKELQTPENYRVGNLVPKSLQNV